MKKQTEYSSRSDSFASRVTATLFTVFDSYTLTAVVMMMAVVEVVMVIVMMMMMMTKLVKE